MSNIPKSGTLTSLDAVAADLKRCIGERGFAEPRIFEKAAEQILVDHPNLQALVLPEGAVIEGDLQVDYDVLSGQRIGTIAVLGDLEVEGSILNDDADGGPFLFVVGNLKAREIVKGGGSFTVLGSLECGGVVFCDYNHGQLLVAGDIDCKALIANDQQIEVGGRITGTLIGEEEGNMRDMLVPEVFADPEDLQDEWPDGALVRERLSNGLPILKDD